MNLPKLIDNKRKTFSDILREVAKEHKHLSIAVGFWDLPGTAEIIEQIKDYESVRLLIGKEPLSSRFQKYLKNDDEFPDTDIKEDLQESGQDYKEKHADEYRKTGALISKMIEEKRLEVKIFRKPFMHAKVFIFGNFNSAHPIGFIGSSNFTKKGLTAVESGGNIELNTPESTPHIVKYPTSQKQEYGHLSWFEDMWNDADAIEWTSIFRDIVESSPFGDKTFGPYDVYIKTLMEVFPDELVPPEEIDKSIKDVLYSFQRRNAGILINKLEKIGLAMLSDSVGLGKTITAGAVIKHYLNKGETRLIVIAPAALKQQWSNELSEKIELIPDQHFKIISQQDLGAINDLIEFNSQPWMKNNPVNLFVIDEAHNLRHSGGERYRLILKLLQQSEQSKVLLLTATPLNNSLMDLVHQIRLAAKGNLKSSVNVFYKEQSRDFFEVLEMIQRDIKKHNREGKEYDYELVKKTIHQGLINYLVRLTRQGVETEGGILDAEGKKKAFPKSRVFSIKYDYSEEVKNFVFEGIEKKLNVFEGIDPRVLNLEFLSEFTQITSHPLDIIKQISKDPDFIERYFGLDQEKIKKLKMKKPQLQ